LSNSAQFQHPSSVRIRLGT